MFEVNDGIFHLSPFDFMHWRIVGYGKCQIIFLHGFASSLHSWDELVPFFPPENYKLHLLDLKGHGESIKPVGGDYSAWNNARIIAAYIELCGLKNITIIGHSFGGLVGLLTSLICPVVTRLVLIDSLCFPQLMPRYLRILSIPLLGPLAMLIIPARTIARKGLEAAFCQRELITALTIKRYARLYRGLAAALAISRTARRLQQCNSHLVVENYYHVAIPTLIVWGQFDRVIHLSQGKRLHEEIPRSRFTIIPNCGHNPQEEMPVTTYNIIRDFLSDYE